LNARKIDIGKVPAITDEGISNGQEFAAVKEDSIKIFCYSEKLSTGICLSHDIYEK
jgi:hypothetical protein